MEFKLGQSWLLQLFSILFLISNLQQNRANAEPQVPCYFIFGDSLSDNGNNNNLNTLAKVNYPPYGIDFPDGPTGRFSDGRNMHDFIVKYLGFQDDIPPFAGVRLSPENKIILKGVNYASGSAGIRLESGEQMGTRIPLDDQIENHETIVSRITRILGDYTSARKHLNKCIFSVQIGSNDYLNNYFKPEFYNTSRQYDTDKYAAVLLEQLSQHITSLYGFGARKFAIYGLGLIGCTPYAINLFGTNGSLCVDKLNQAVEPFNNKLQALVKELNTNLTDAKFTYINPAPDFTLKFDGSCCKPGGGAGELCIPNSEPCSDRKKYLFWDGVHPSEANYEAFAKSAYSSVAPTEAYPYNIQTLAKQKNIKA